ncbi:MAG: hypothetical protein JNM10_08090 [Planctomycetia bacterium]|nr:hypothetical protein [Planctomycetia bacterium]
MRPSRRTLRASWALVAALTLSGGRLAADPPTEATLFPPLKPERVAELMREIAAPVPADQGWDGMGPVTHPFDVLDHHAHSSRDAVDELADQGPARVDADLLRLAREGSSFDARCRALRTLALRGRRDGDAILGSLVVSPRPAERYVAWRIARDSVGDDHVGPVAATLALERLRAETDELIVGRIEAYLGEIRSAEAVPLLLEALASASRRDCLSTGYALGLLGVKDAVPALIAAGRKVREQLLPALGRIGTPEAVEYLIGRLDDYGAADALVDSKSPRAIPALEAHRAGLERRPTFAGARSSARLDTIAILLLRHPDPCPDLLSVVEDPLADADLRRDAVNAFLRVPRDQSARYHTRLAAAYAKESTSSVCAQFLRVLSKSRAPGVTEAMLHNAAVLAAPRSKFDMAPAWLLRMINRRLGTAYATLAEAAVHGKR